MSRTPPLNLDHVITALRIGGCCVVSRTADAVTLKMPRGRLVTLTSRGPEAKEGIFQAVKMLTEDMHIAGIRTDPRLYLRMARSGVVPLRFKKVRRGNRPGASPAVHGFCGGEGCSERLVVEIPDGLCLEPGYVRTSIGTFGSVYTFTGRASDIYRYRSRKLAYRERAAPALHKDYTQVTLSDYQGPGEPHIVAHDSHGRHRSRALIKWRHLNGQNGPIIVCKRCGAKVSLRTEPVLDWPR